MGNLGGRWPPTAAFFLVDVAWSTGLPATGNHSHLSSHLSLKGTRGKHTRPGQET